MNDKEIGWEGWDGIHLVQGRDLREDFNTPVNTDSTALARQ